MMIWRCDTRGSPCLPPPRETVLRVAPSLASNTSIAHRRACDTSPPLIPSRARTPPITRDARPPPDPPRSRPESLLDVVGGAQRDALMPRQLVVSTTATASSSSAASCLARRVNSSSAPTLAAARTRRPSSGLARRNVGTTAAVAAAHDETPAPIFYSTQASTGVL